MHSQRPTGCLSTCEPLNGPRPASSHSSSSSLFSPWCLPVWNNHQNTLRIMALSRPPLSDLIKNKLAITSRDAEHILLRRSQATTQMWTAMSSWRRMCPAFFKQAQGQLTDSADVWCGSRHKPRMGNSCLFWAPLSPPLLGCMPVSTSAPAFLSWKQSELSSAYLAPKEWILLRSCLERCYLEV